MRGVPPFGSAAAAKRPDRVLVGIAFMLGATAMFAVSSALSKWQVADYSFDEVLFFRALGSLGLIAALILPRAGLKVFWTRRLKDHAARSVTQTIAQSCIVIAFSLMPLGGAVAINFASPLFATLFAALWLKERVDPVRGTALVVGFCGVLLVAAPGADSFRIGALFALTNAVLYGSVTAAVRGMTKTESAETLTIYQMVFLTLFFTLGLPVFGFIWPTWTDLCVMLLNGVINAVGQYWWTRSLTLAPPAAVGPFYYFSLVWALVLGFAFWGEVPGLPLLAGSAVVVGSGLALLWHERR
jgi:drug/metabolite transporter (DMT)-like permease